MNRTLAFFRGFELTLLKRPDSRRGALLRLAVVGAVVVAGIAPFLLTSVAQDVREIAGVRFLEYLDELEEVRARINLLEEDPNTGPSELQALRVREAELEELTTLGYLPRDGDSPREGRLAPDFRLLDLEGHPFRLSDVGGPAVVNFWASWCPFCIDEMPDFQRIQEMVGDQVTIIGINRADSLLTARRFADETGARYTLLLDPEDDLGGGGGPYRVIGMPTTFYVAADGRITEVAIGFQTIESISEAVGRLLGEEIPVHEPTDTGFEARVTKIIASQRANHAVAGELFARFAANPQVVSDIVWQRNVVGQARAWVVNLQQLQAISPTESLAALHAQVVDAMLILDTAAALLEIGVDTADAEQIGRGIDIFQAGVPAFDEAAADLTESLALD